jgi:hypothetical protein
MKYDRRYIPITQEPFCCVPASIQMVLLRRNIPQLSQEEIGYELGLTVPKRYKKILPMARTGKRPPGGWGTQIKKEEYNLNNFFNKHGIPLEETYISPYFVDEDGECLDDFFSKDCDILVCFDYGKLYDKKKSGKNGHVSVLDSLSDGIATVVEPGYDLPKYREVEFKRLLDAMKTRGEDNMGGFWLIKSK